MALIQKPDCLRESSEVLESTCDEILRLDPKIRFVGIIDDKGKLLAGNKRNDVEKFVDEKDLEILLMELALGVRMRREHDERLGPVNFTISYGSKMLTIHFPLGDKILCMSAEKDIDMVKMSFLILSLLETKSGQKGQYQ